MSDQPPAPTPSDVEKLTKWQIASAIAVIPGAIWTAPYRRAFRLYTWHPLRAIRATANRKTLVPLVKNWKEDKYAELQSVQVAATFCGGAVFSTLPWARDNDAIWATDALWYSALICAISAIITSIQTKSILDDLPTNDQLESELLSDNELKRMRRAILRYKETPGIKHWVMLFIWQFPSMTAAYAWCCYLSGLTFYMCTPFVNRQSFNNGHKICIVYLSVAIICLLTYVFSTFFVYTGERELLYSVSSTRSGTLDSTRTNTLEMETLLAAGYAGRPDPRRSKTDQLIIEHRERGIYGRTKRQLLYS